MSRSPQKTPKNLYKTLILTNFSIQFTRLHYIAVSQIGFEPNSNRKRLESGFDGALCPSQTEKPLNRVAFAVRFIWNDGIRT